MAATIDATVGGASANSYCTLAVSETYMAERTVSTTWDAATGDEKNRALITATRRLDQEKFEGEKVATGQALKWPRYWATDDNGDELATNAIPTIIVHATIEMALRLINDDATDTLADTGLEEFKSAKIGPMEVERWPSFKAGQLPANVKRLLRPVIVTPGMSVRMERA